MAARDRLRVGTAAMAFAAGTLSPLAPALAQDNIEQTENAEAPKAETGDIIVTARKRSERLQDVPGVIISTQASQLRELRITDVQTLSQYVPSFTQSIATPNPRYYLRGVGSGANASFEQAVGNYADGVYRGRGLLGRIPYFDIESVDVQLGPQVVLYGNSSTAGGINVRSNRPTDKFEGFVDAAYEFRHNQTTLQGAVNLPLADRLQLRVAGYFDDLSRGWIRTTRPLANPANVTYDPRVDDRAMRVSLAAQPSDDLDIVLRYELADTSNIGGTLQIAGTLRDLPFIEPDFDLDRESGTPAPPWSKYRSEDVVDLHSQTLIGEVNWDLGGGKLTAITGYNWFDYVSDVDPDQTRLGIVQFIQNEDFTQFSQEMRYAFDLGSSIDLIVGGYYQRNNLKRIVRTDVNFSALGLAFPSFTRTIYLNQRQQDLSAFANATVRLSPELTFEGGVRFSHVRKTGDQGANPTDFETTNFNPAYLALYRGFFGIPHDLLDLKLRENHLMPEATLEYRPTSGVMLYAKFARGAKSGGFDDNYSGDLVSGTAKRTGPNSVTYRSETVTSYEAGLRYETDDRKLQVGATGYYVQVSDLQVGVFNGNTNFVVGNADSRSYGVEAFVNLRPTPSFTINGLVSYVDAKYSRFTDAACTVAQSLAVSPCSQDLSGTPVPVPDLMFNLAASHKLEVGDYTISSRASWNYRAGYNFSDTFDPLLARPSISLVDVSVGFGPTNGRWEISAFAKNLLDERWSNVGGSTPLVRGTVFSDTQRPFHTGLQLRVRLGD